MHIPRGEWHDVSQASSRITSPVEVDAGRLCPSPLLPRSASGRRTCRTVDPAPSPSRAPFHRLRRSILQRFAVVANQSSAESRLATRLRGTLGGCTRLGVLVRTRTPLRSRPTEPFGSFNSAALLPPRCKSLLVHDSHVRFRRLVSGCLCAPPGFARPRGGSIANSSAVTLLDRAPPQLSVNRLNMLRSCRWVGGPTAALHAFALAPPRLVRGSIRFSFPVQP
jgi:hypothetical protein